MTRRLEDLTSPYLSGLIPYVPGKPTEEVERELGISGSVKLASNENPLGPSPKALAALQAALPELHRYPDGPGFRLCQALARHWGVAADMLVLGNGSNELLELVGRAFLVPGDEVVYAEQAFVVYEMVAQTSGATRVRVPLKDFTHDLDGLRRAITPKTKLVFLANPNNPTGTAVPPQALETFLADVPPEVVVVLDEAYYEYLPEGERPDALRFVREGRWLLVLRTFSKIYGLAGLRLGYGMGPAPLTAILHRLRAPFNTNALAQAGAIAALTDTEHVARSRAVNEAGRRLLTEGLARLGLRVVPNVANFVLVDVGRSGAATSDALLRRGVIVRPVAGYGFPNHLRITIGTPEENTRCLAALAALLGKENPG
ncbi:MAG: histidinol-phosphate transaminase [candidate division NC10 bacterium]|nr:histidinol-phosphate transaminase [candidate division NC10 bacterium]